MKRKELEKLKNELKNIKDYKEVLAAEFGLQPSSIQHILNGYRKNDAVIIAAVKMVAEHQQKMQEVSEFLDSL